MSYNNILTGIDGCIGKTIIIIIIVATNLKKEKCS